MSAKDEATREGGSPIAWDRRYPGRLQWELDWLSYLGASPQLDEEAFKRGVAVVRFSWVVDGQTVDLEATFPASYPHVRPQVRFRNGAAKLQRHVSPTDGTICLIGRDGRQWVPELGLARLVDEKLAEALNGTGEEDPQGEPNEYWWNTAAIRSHSYVLVDSGWDLKGSEQGFFDLRYHADAGRPPVFRAVVDRILDQDKKVLGRFSGMVPPEFADAYTARIKWVRTDKPLAPIDNGKDFQALIAPSGPFGPSTGTQFAKRLFGTLYAIAHPTELTQGVLSDGWLFCLLVNKDPYFIQTLRAGATDIGHRVPSVRHLRDTTVAIVGAGAIGAFAALELARNGCGKLRLVEYDQVEPGNSIRWPLGATAWGVRKGEALQQFIESEYPWCAVQLCPVAIGDVGNAADESAQLRSVISGADAIVDCAANEGVTNTLWQYAVDLELPLISAWATPPVSGGIVAKFHPGAACPACLHYAHLDGAIAPPPGNGDDAGLLQPPGCAERTFTGPSMSLEEIALETVRLTVDVLAGNQLGSVVETLELVDADGARIPPRWRTAPLDRHTDCRCNV